MAGVTAGGLAAVVYGLYREEWTATFIATWYTLGIAASGSSPWQDVGSFDGDGLDERTMTLLLNILWFLPGGFATGLSWMVGAILAITIVGLPWAGAAFRIGLFAFAPFGRRVVPRSALTGHEDLGSGCLGAGLNVVWFVFAGWYIALARLLVGLAQAVTLIGIPFAIQNFKLAIVALAPVGKTVTPAY